jgi:hypothetical protein
MHEFYGGGARALQDRFGTRPLADRFGATIVRDHATDEDRAFIEGRDFFMLATVDRDGWPQCSYKGGACGFVRVPDAHRLLFPCLDGNGMFLSMGNVADTAKVALLFIDFENPKRLRLAGRATLVDDPGLVATWPEAQFAVSVAIERVWPNCPRYIHRYQRLESSPYVPEAGRETPVPGWKQMEFVRDVLPPRDR